MGKIRKENLWQKTTGTITARSLLRSWNILWNGGKPKIDVRDWNERHDRMSRGITLTEEQGEKLVKALGQRMLDKQKARTERDPYER